MFISVLVIGLPLLDTFYNQRLRRLVSRHSPVGNKKYNIQHTPVIRMSCYRCRPVLRDKILSTMWRRGVSIKIDKWHAREFLCIHRQLRLLYYDWASILEDCHTISSFAKL